MQPEQRKEGVQVVTPGIYLSYIMIRDLGIIQYCRGRSDLLVLDALRAGSTQGLFECVASGTTQCLYAGINQMALPLAGSMRSCSPAPASSIVLINSGKC
jgi:hypothetical protein